GEYRGDRAVGRMRVWMDTCLGAVRSAVLESGRTRVLGVFLCVGDAPYNPVRLWFQEHGNRGKLVAGDKYISRCWFDFCLGRCDVFPLSEPPPCAVELFCHRGGGGVRSPSAVHVSTKSQILDTCLRLARDFGPGVSFSVPFWALPYR